jgi:hypothetical protein
LDLSLNGGVAAEEERQTDTQTWAFRPRFFIQGPKCSRVVVVVAAAAAAQQQSLCSNWVALELLSFVGGCHHLFCLQKKREEHLCHCQKLAGELLLILLFVHLSETHTHTHTQSLSLSLFGRSSTDWCVVFGFWKELVVRIPKKERKGGDLGFVSWKEEEEGDLGVAAAWVGCWGGGRQRKEER